MEELQVNLWRSFVAAFCLGIHEVDSFLFRLVCYIKCNLVVIDSGLWIVRIEVHISIYREENNPVVGSKYQSDICYVFAKSEPVG